MAGCTSAEIRKQALQGASTATPLTLHDLIASARLEEPVIKQQLRRQSKASYEVNASAASGGHKKAGACNNCGYDHTGRECPAKGKMCNHCKKVNHFSSVCRSKLAGKPPAPAPGTWQTAIRSQARVQAWPQTPVQGQCSFGPNIVPTQLIRGLRYLVLVITKN